MSEASSTAREAERTPDLRVRPPLRPPWLLPSLAAVVVLTHVAFFASGVYWPEPQYADLGAIDAALIPEGDSLEAGEAAPEGEDLDADKVETARPEEEEGEVAVPLPPDKSPDALPQKKKVAKADRKPVKKPADRAAGSTPGPAKKRFGLPSGTGTGSGTSRVGGRYGLPGGRGPAGGATQATCLAQVAASVRRHLPGATSLGPGTAFVTFYINPGGGVSGVNVSASSPAHAALARRIVASSRGPASCGSAYASQSLTFE